MHALNAILEHLKKKLKQLLVQVIIIIIIYKVCIQAGREWMYSIRPKTPIPQSQPIEEIKKSRKQCIEDKMKEAAQTNCHVTNECANIIKLGYVALS